MNHPTHTSSILLFIPLLAVSCAVENDRENLVSLSPDAKADLVIATGFDLLGTYELVSQLGDAQDALSSCQPDPAPSWNELDSDLALHGLTLTPIDSDTVELTIEWANLSPQAANYPALRIEVEEGSGARLSSMWDETFEGIASYTAQYYVGPACELAVERVRITIPSDEERVDLSLGLSQLGSFSENEPFPFSAHIAIERL